MRLLHLKFFSFSQDTKTESSLNTVKLSFLILLCITEDQYGNALMHDPNLVFRVRVHRAPMRHRKPSTQWLSEANSKCLASAVLDLMVRAYWYFMFRNDKCSNFISFYFGK